MKSTHLQTGAGWDYLIVTASNESQAKAYQSQLNIRQKLGLLAGVDKVLVVSDPQGQRIGSGGSTLLCLMHVLKNSFKKSIARSSPKQWRDVLSKLRILIIHAGGDSRRLTAYGACGKIFLPVPGETDRAIYLSLFDRQLPTYLALPQTSPGTGQVVITSGDVLLRFDPTSVCFADEGITALACYASPQQAARHGVFCCGPDHTVRRYLQKPSIANQKKYGAIDLYERSCLDIGVMNFDASTAVQLLKCFGAIFDRRQNIDFRPSFKKAIFSKGLDFYREICCAFGSQTQFSDFEKNAYHGGSTWSTSSLKIIYQRLHETKFYMQLLTHCEFLDFGSTQSIIPSAGRLLQEDRGLAGTHAAIDLNNHISDTGQIVGHNAWIEGCSIKNELRVSGQNMVVGVDVAEPLTVPPQMCLDVIEGTVNRRKVWFVRCYGLNDSFKQPLSSKIQFCGMDIRCWLETIGAKASDIWDAKLKDSQRSLWNAKLFAAVQKPGAYRDFIWMLEPDKASDQDITLWKKSRRYSFEQMLDLADHKQFLQRRIALTAKRIANSLGKLFSPDSHFSASELSFILKNTTCKSLLLAEIVEPLKNHHQNNALSGSDVFVYPRILHSTATALSQLSKTNTVFTKAIAPSKQSLSPQQKRWLRINELSIRPDERISTWTNKAKAKAFTYLGDAIVSSAGQKQPRPHHVLRSDEIIWARSPARLDFAGGWTDTPPYALEYGGCVVNGAIDLNGQPPIHVYARIINEPVIRIGSIDVGVRIEIHKLDDLLDYRKATSSFALAKAALALSGFSPEYADWKQTVTLKRMLNEFGGGIELTTLAAIPKGSGLGTSSIMGAALVSAIERMKGNVLSPRELFHSVLRLEQALTTGGGWQDQIGGTVDGVKKIIAEAGMIPNTAIHYLPDDIVNSRSNGGQTLLYYTGITRLAKNILQQVVGRYLDRDRATMATLHQIHQLTDQMSDVFVKKDTEQFGMFIDRAWSLNKQLDPNSTNPQIERLLKRVRPYIIGAKLLGAGGGGFLLMVCRSPVHAVQLKTKLKKNPPNPRARFFEYTVSRNGLVVTVC